MGLAVNLGAVMTGIVSPKRIVLVKDPMRTPALWKIPGGSIEFGETVIEAAIRESQEETGIELLMEEIRHHSEEARVPGQRYRPHFCIARVSEEKLDTHKKRGDENGNPIMVGVFDLAEVAQMVDLLDPHRPFAALLTQVGT